MRNEIDRLHRSVHYAAAFAFLAHHPQLRELFVTRGVQDGLGSARGAFPASLSCPALSATQAQALVSAITHNQSSPPHRHQTQIIESLAVSSTGFRFDRHPQPPCRRRRRRRSFSLSSIKLILHRFLSLLPHNYTHFLRHPLSAGLRFSLLPFSLRHSYTTHRRDTFSPCTHNNTVASTLCLARASQLCRLTLIHLTSAVPPTHSQSPCARQAAITCQALPLRISGIC